MTSRITNSSRVETTPTQLDEPAIKKRPANTTNTLSSAAEQAPKKSAFAEFFSNIWNWILTHIFCWCVKAPESESSSIESPTSAEIKKNPKKPTPVISGKTQASKVEAGTSESKSVAVEIVKDSKKTIPATSGKTQASKEPQSGISATDSKTTSLSSKKVISLKLPDTTNNSVSSTPDIEAPESPKTPKVASPTARELFLTFSANRSAPSSNLSTRTEPMKANNLEASIVSKFSLMFTHSFSFLSLEEAQANTKHRATIDGKGLTIPLSFCKERANEAYEAFRSYKNNPFFSHVFNPHIPCITIQSPYDYIEFLANECQFTSEEIRDLLNNARKANSITETEYNKAWIQFEILLKARRMFSYLTWEQIDATKIQPKESNQPEPSKGSRKQDKPLQYGVIINEPVKAKTLEAGVVSTFSQMFSTPLLSLKEAQENTEHRATIDGKGLTISFSFCKEKAAAALDAYHQYGPRHRFDYSCDYATISITILRPSSYLDFLGSQCKFPSQDIFPLLNHAHLKGSLNDEEYDTAWNEFQKLCLKGTIQGNLQWKDINKCKIHKIESNLPEQPKGSRKKEDPNVTVSAAEFAKVLGTKSTSQDSPGQSAISPSSSVFSDKPYRSTKEDPIVTVSAKEFAKVLGTKSAQHDSSGQSAVPSSKSPSFDKPGKGKIEEPYVTVSAEKLAKALKDEKAKKRVTFVDVDQVASAVIPTIQADPLLSFEDPSVPISNLSSRVSLPALSPPDAKEGKSKEKQTFPRKLPLVHTILKGQKNAEKAIDEHIKEELLKKGINVPFVSKEEALPPVEVLLNPPKLAVPLKFKTAHHIAQGPRPSMEDAHFTHLFEDGLLAGVFDGHGDAFGENPLAHYVNEQFPLRFPEELKKTNGNVHQAFETLIHALHEEVIKKDEWEAFGTTATVCYIDQNTGLAYTATVGDSETNGYRKFKGTLKSIPFSVVRNWKSKSDAKRAADALEDEKVFTTYTSAANSKLVAFPGKDPNYRQMGSINVARAIGDRTFALYKANPDSTKKVGVSHKPKIVVQLVKAGDILLIRCDGSLDYSSEKDIVDLVNKVPDVRFKEVPKHSLPFEDLPEAVVNRALNDFPWRRGDNVTCVAIQIS